MPATPSAGASGQGPGHPAPADRTATLRQLIPQAQHPSSPRRWATTTTPRPESATTAGTPKPLRLRRPQPVVVNLSDRQRIHDSRLRLDYAAIPVAPETPNPADKWSSADHGGPRRHPLRLRKLIPLRPLRLAVYGLTGLAIALVTEMTLLAGSPSALLAVDEQDLKAQVRRVARALGWFVVFGVVVLVL